MSDNIEKILVRKQRLSKEALSGYLEKQKELFQIFEEEIQKNETFKDETGADRADQKGIVVDLLNVVWAGLDTYLNNVSDETPMPTNLDGELRSDAQGNNDNGSSITNQSGPNLLLQIPKTFKLDSNTPIFKRMNGEISIEDWILTIETNMRLAKIEKPFKQSKTNWWFWKIFG